MDTKAVMKSDAKKKNKLSIIIAATVLVLVLTVAGTLILTTPRPSVTAFCTVYKEEDARLVKSSGSTYGVKVFSRKSSNPTDFIEAFSRLEKVAPEDIRSDVKILRQVFQKIESDPTQAISASVSGLSAEKTVTEYIEQNCR